MNTHLKSIRVLISAEDCIYKELSTYSIQRAYSPVLNLCFSVVRFQILTITCPITKQVPDFSVNSWLPLAVYSSNYTILQGLITFTLLFMFLLFAYFSSPPLGCIWRERFKGRHGKSSNLSYL